MSKIEDKLSNRINTIINRAYIEAGLTDNDPSTGIVPIRELIKAFPIRVVEMPNLSYVTAYQFLESEVGQLFSSEDLEARRLAGFLYATGTTSATALCLMFIEANDPIPRRRFTVSHELGHFMLHFMAALDDDTINPFGEQLTFLENTAYPEEIEESKDIPSGDVFFTRGIDQIPYVDSAIEELENEANEFAASILMPEQACRELFNHYAPRCNFLETAMVKSLAAHLLVSQQAMRWRLKQLDLL